MVRALTERDEAGLNQVALALLQTHMAWDMVRLGSLGLTLGGAQAPTSAPCWQEMWEPVP